MTGGYRSICPYCKNSVLSRDIGAHILKNHEEAIFTKDNLKSLHRDKYFKQPLEVFFDVDTYHICLADNSCIKKSILADKHFKGKADKHKEAILRLREKYPLVSASSETTATHSAPLLSSRETKTIQESMGFLLAKIRDLERKAAVDEADAYEFDKKQLMAFSKIGILVDDKSLQELYPDLFETPTVDEPVVEEEAPVLVEPEDDILSFVPEKKMTLQDVIRETFTEKDIKNLSTSVTSGQVVEIPELQQLMATVKPAPAPAPAPVPVPVVAPIAVPDFSKMSHWQRYKHANPTMTEAELIEGASFLGIQPDKGMSPEMAALMYKSASLQRAPEPSFGNLIQNTKAKRAPKMC
jgi:hypothetical protein